MEWEAVIGLEVHAQLQTHTKIFSSESTAFGQGPNMQVNEVCAGLPGVLPVFNADAVQMAVKAGLALGCQINLWSQFARKNYFYPDLPKGYQISQYEHPICTGGGVEFLVNGEPMRCNLTRIHMEEDAGKSTHAGHHSFVDLNRAGVPLIEIVAEPDLRTAEQAAAYLRELRNILRYIGVCDGNLEQGSFRCDANVSVRRPGDPFGTRAEIKNLNSFRFVQKAIDYEINRQIDLIESGQKVVQETRLFNADTGKTFSMRSKEDAHDYRYFPDPDLPPLIITQEEVDALQKNLPALPGQRRARYQELGLSAYDASVLTQSRAVAEFFETACEGNTNAKGVANWVMNEVLRVASNPEEGLDDLSITPAHISELVQMIDKNEITGKIAKTVFARMLETGKKPSIIADEEGLRPVRDEGKLLEVLKEIVAANAAQAQQYKDGKQALAGFFIGQVMKKTRGKADPKLTRELLHKIVHEDA